MNTGKFQCLRALWDFFQTFVCRLYWFGASASVFTIADLGPQPFTFLRDPKTVADDCWPWLACSTTCDIKVKRGYEFCFGTCTTAFGIQDLCNCIVISVISNDHENLIQRRVFFLWFNDTIGVADLANLSGRVRHHRRFHRKSHQVSLWTSLGFSGPLQDHEEKDIHLKKKAMCWEWWNWCNHMKPVQCSLVLLLLVYVTYVTCIYWFQIIA